MQANPAENFTRRAAMICMTAVSLMIVRLSAQDIQPYKAADVQPYRAQPVPSDTPRKLPTTDPVMVSNLLCSQLQCTAAADSIHIRSGRPELANERLTLVLFDNSRKPVSTSRITVGADGLLAADIAVRALAAGAYRFGLVSADESHSVVAAGEFAIKPAAPKKRFAGLPERLDANLARQRHDSAPSRPDAAQQPVSGPQDFFFRTFGLAIPGVVYTTNNYSTNTRTVTVAARTVTKSAVRIQSDGTYIWNSAWDGKVIRGHWQRHGSAIVLLNAQSGLDWRMERLPQPQGKAVISIWDQNSIWYHGTPLE